MSSSNRSNRTGVNSAYRKMERDRQDSRWAMVAGVAFGLLVLMALIFGHQRVEKDPLPTSADSVAQDHSTKDSLRAYAQSTPALDKVDAIVNGDSGR